MSATLKEIATDLRRRWPVERGHSWLNRFRRILVRWEKRADTYRAMLDFACATITWGQVWGQADLLGSDLSRSVGATQIPDHLHRGMTDRARCDLTSPFEAERKKAGTRRFVCRPSGWGLRDCMTFSQRFVF